MNHIAIVGLGYVGLPLALQFARSGAKVLGFKVVAEGVEEEAQIRILTTMGCDIFQGFFFSKPLLPADFVEFHKRTAAGII